MSSDKIEKILATYKPVEGRPGYVWISDETIADLEIVRAIYEEEFGKVGEIKNKDE